MNRFFIRSYFLLFILNGSKILYGQSLIPNGGFETYVICPVGFSEFSGKVANWLNPNAGTPDYMNACANPNPAGVPKNGIGYQNAHGGQAYTGTYTFSGTSYREFIQIKLTSNLIAGHSYYLTMYTVLHNKSQTAIDDIGAYISVTAPTSGGTGMLAGSPVPQISNPFGSVITDTVNWTLISGTYIAVGGERYLTVGHLKNDASTTYFTLAYGTIGAYYYFDDVTLVDLTVLPVTITNFSGQLTTGNLDPLIELTWSTSNELNNCCFKIEKSGDGVLFNEIGNVTGAGNSNTIMEYQFIDEHPFDGSNFYRLNQIDNDGSYDYSETIFINNVFEAIVTDAWVYDNTLFVNNYSDHVLEASLFTVTGQNLKSISLDAGANEWKIPETFTGILLLVINNTETKTIQTVKKIVIH